MNDRFKSIYWSVDGTTSFSLEYLTYSILIITENDLSLSRKSPTVIGSPLVYVAVKIKYFCCSVVNVVLVNVSIEAPIVPLLTISTVNS